MKTMHSLFCFVLTMSFMLIGAAAYAQVFIDMPLDRKNCETFTVGESGHSDRCRGPNGYGLIIHDRRSRIDIEILYPGDTRGAKVHRLNDFLGEWQRHLAQPSIRWLVIGKGKAAKVVAFAIRFDVEPQPYELFIPLTLVIRVEQNDRECVIATLDEGSKRNLDAVMQNYAKAECRSAFPK